MIITALRVVCGLVPFSLPSLEPVTPQLAKTVFTIMDKHAGGIGTSVGGSRTDVGEASLRAFTLMLRQCKFMRVSDAQLRAVLAFIRSDIDIPARQNATFAVISVRTPSAPRTVALCSALTLIMSLVSCGCVVSCCQAIVKRKLVVPEVYDLMDHMANLMIRSVVPNARQLCGHTFLLFLIKCAPPLPAFPSVPYHRTHTSRAHRVLPAATTQLSAWQEAPGAALESLHS